MKRFLIIFFTLCFFSVYAEPLPYYIIDGMHEDNSVTKLWYTALGLVDQYDVGKIAGFEIDLGSEGKHYSSEKGDNWWSYYFAFTHIGSCKGAVKKRLARHKRSTIRFRTVCTMTPERAHYLLATYMPLQQNIVDSLQYIKKTYWPDKSFVIGVYYQKPMVSEVQNNWSPETLVTRVKIEAQKHPGSAVVLLTDLPGYAELLEKEFGVRFTDLSVFVEQKKESPVLCGQTELLTLLLLAQCDLVIAPGSYQGIGAKMLAPSMQLIELDTIPYAVL